MGCSEDTPTTPAETDYTEFLAEFPPCTTDCGITSPTELCTFLDNPDYANDVCMDDCTEEDLPEQEMVDGCNYCLQFNNCDEIFLGDDCGSIIAIS